MLSLAPTHLYLRQIRDYQAGITAACLRALDLDVVSVAFAVPFVGELAANGPSTGDLTKVFLETVVLFLVQHSSKVLQLRLIAASQAVAEGMQQVFEATIAAACKVRGVSCA